MKIICSSDLHGHLPEIPECDVLCIAGDLIPKRYLGDARRQMAWLIDDFDKWCREQPAKDILINAGNHDKLFQDLEVRKKLNARWENEEPPYQYLQDSSVIIDHVKFHASPWVREFCYMPFEASDGVAKMFFDLIPEDVDVLMSHSPPYGICDWGGFQEKAGHKPLLERVKFVKPKLHVFGHIHACAEQWKELEWEDKSKSLFANVAFVDNNYEPAHKFLEYDFESRMHRWVRK
jgi:Icc-related predicted phosphoesterase